MSQEPTAARFTPPTTVVVPLDGSVVADAALPAAHHLAAVVRAKVQRVTVCEKGDRPSEGPRVDVTLSGEPTEAILAHLDTLAAPLVVLSSHGRTGRTKRRVGSVAERIIRRAWAPVVVVGPKLDRSLPLLAPRTLLVAVGPPPVPAGLMTATAGWAGSLGAAVVLAHVRDPDAPDTDPVPDLAALAAELTDAGVANVRREELLSPRPTRTLVDLSSELTPPVLFVAQAHPEEEVEGSRQLTYKLLRHSNWPVMATVGRRRPSVPEAGSDVDTD